MNDATFSDATLRLGLLGFGEAGQRFGRDFVKAGLTSVIAFSRSAAAAGADAPVRAFAREHGIALAATPKELCARADLIIALTPGTAALPALRSVKRYLGKNHLYVDANTVGVKTIARIAKLLEGRCAFVDAAIMSAVPLDGIKAPILASGAAAARFSDLVAPYGMPVQVVGAEPGAASAMKLIRSVCMKGLAALLLESLEAAQRCGVRDAVAADMAKFIDDRPFQQVIKRFVCGTAVHAGRRIHEMADSLELLKSVGAPTRMTRATQSMFKELIEMKMPERYNGREPDSIEPVLAALVETRG
jgi:3-hydroxyisobutyrate dehydrogenase-like beta-hydroxyacid dehydrogenase